MLHSVGCPQPNATVFVNNWNSPNYGDACVHAFIDGNNGNVYQTLPWNHRGWHAGGSANNTHIGVEMCEPSSIRYYLGSNFSYSDINDARQSVKITYESAVELFAYLCKKYGLNPLGDGVIVSHNEGYIRGIASNHGDPEHLWTGLSMGYTMDGFRKDVYAKMHGSSSSSSSNRGSIVSIPKSGKIRVIYEGADGVEVHNTPDFEDNSCNSIYGPVGPKTNKGSVFTVVAEIKLASGYKMYQLKSGLYITASSKYVKFID